MGSPPRRTSSGPSTRNSSGPHGRIIRCARAIAVNAIIVWNTVYTGRVLDELRAAGELITTSEIEHISPLAHQHIHLYGHYPFDLATRPDGHRLLRPLAESPASASKTANRV